MTDQEWDRYVDEGIKAQCKALGIPSPFESQASQVRRFMPGLRAEEEAEYREALRTGYYISDLPRGCTRI